MKVTAIEDAIIQRVGKQVLENFGGVFLLEQMNRIYKETNEELKCLTKEYEFDFSSGTAAVDQYMDLPAGWLWPIRIDPKLTFRYPKVFSLQENDTYTMMSRRLYVAGATEQTVLDVLYISQGLSLVESNPVADASVDEPEWNPEIYHSYLIYAVAIDLGINYPMLKKDIINYNRLRNALSRSSYLIDLADAPTTGPQARLSYVDPYM